MTERETVTLCFDVEADAVNVALLRDLLQDGRRSRWLRVLLAETLGQFLGGSEAFRFTVTDGVVSASVESEG
jgi:hypothetical protein